MPAPERVTCPWRDLWTPFLPLSPCQLFPPSVGITLHPPPQHLLLPYMGDTCQAHLTFIFVGSKNPKIALKLAEFQADSQGKVRGAGELQRSFWMKRGAGVCVVSWVDSWAASAGCLPSSHARCLSWPTECKTVLSRALLPGCPAVPCHSAPHSEMTRGPHHLGSCCSGLHSQ